MAEWLVDFDYTETVDTSWYDDNDELVEDFDIESFSDEIVVEADDEEQARDKAYDRLRDEYEDFYVWAVRGTGLSEED